MSRLFDKSAIKFAILAGLIMSTSDETADDEEFAIVNAFLREHWEHDFGDKGEMLDEVTHYKGQLFPSKIRKENIARLAEILHDQFTFAQKESFLEFISRIKDADGIEDPDEVAILEAFRKGMMA